MSAANCRNGAGFSNRCLSNISANDRALYKGRRARSTYSHAAQTVEIAAGIDRAALGLLGGHEFRRPQHAAHPGETHVAEQSRDAEVGKFQDSFLGQQQVAGLDVAMDHAAVVGVPQCPGDGDAELGHLPPVKRAAAAKLLFQAAAGHEFHRIEDLLLLLAKAENLHDIRMIELSQGLDLGLETFAEVGLLGHVGGQQFDGGRLARRVIDAQVDRAHAAAANSCGRFDRGQGEREAWGGRSWDLDLGCLGSWCLDA